MTREHYHTELKRIQDETCVLGTMVGTGLTEAVGQLCRADRAGAERLIDWDQRVNEMRYRIELHVLTLIATQAPVAGDMRSLASVLETIGELERIGDYAKGIARINLKLARPFVPRVQDILTEMALKSRDMLDRALEAFSRNDMDLARAIIREDDAVDALFNRLFHIVITETDVSAGSPNGGAEGPMERANYLMWVAHNLERSADRVTNICQRVVFTVTGRLEDLDLEPA